MTTENVNTGVNTEVEEVVETPQLTEVEQRAMSLGWKPEDKWVEEGHDAKDHRSAKDFLERGEMIGTIRSTQRELQQTKQAVDHLVNQQKRTYERGYEQAIVDLKAQRKEALAEGDVVKAEEILEKIDDTKEALAKVKATPAAGVKEDVDPEYYPWVDANPWYNDGVMRKFADALAIEYVALARQQGSTFTNRQVRDFVTQTVKKEFAHRFDKSAAKVTPAPNPDGEGRTGGREKSGEATQLSKVKSTLSEEERGIMKTICRSTGMTEAQYLKMYSDVGR